jgi:HD superfamily phosphohydrolase YqeK
MLYLADHLEPGRTSDNATRAALRARMPDEHDAVLTAVVRRRIEWIVRSGWLLAPETVAFWNAVASA